uniref:Uncharacterized protein n=1 Tax=Rhizophora mucronata TaxID=61149 RepID=A0A2P2PUF0_RHIMU
MLVWFTYVELVLVTVLFCFLSQSEQYIYFPMTLSDVLLSGVPLN